MLTKYGSEFRNKYRPNFSPNIYDLNYVHPKFELTRSKSICVIDRTGFFFTACEKLVNYISDTNV